MAKAKKSTGKKKRKASPAQLAALARGRAKIAKKRKTSPKKTSVKRVSKKPKSNPVQRQVVVIQPSQEKKVMAKKKSTGTSSTQKKTSSKRRGFAGVAGKAKGMLPVVKEVAFAVAGGVAAGAVANKLPIADNRLKAAIPVAAGILLAGTMGKKNAMLREVGAGMAVIGAIGLIKQFMPNVPVLAGEDQVIVIPDGSGYAGEPMQIGYDDSEDYMGEMMQLGNEGRYISPASL